MRQLEILGTSQMGNAQDTSAEPLHNTHLEHILLKVTTINDLYSTNIFATYTMAQHIHILLIGIGVGFKRGAF
jgi:hypothetical protein